MSAIYLGKNGRSFGPFSRKDIEELRSSEKIHSYTWIWEGEAWKALDPAPPAPSSSVDVKKLSSIEALCFDHHQLLKVKLVKPTESGGELLAIANGSLPPFGASTSVMLNLHDEKSGKTVNIPVRLVEVLREGKNWVYQARWMEANPLSLIG